MDRKIYLEYVPDGHGRRLLVALQDSLRPYAADAIPGYELHLTLVHIGKLGAVYYELRRQHPELDFRRFSDAIDGFASAAAVRMPAAMTLRTRSLAVYGKGRPLLAVELEPDEAIVELQAVCVRELVGRLSQAGLAQAGRYMAGSRSLASNFRFSPHVSLCKTLHRPVNETIVLPETLSFCALPPEHDLKTGVAGQAGL